MTVVRQSTSTTTTRRLSLTEIPDFDFSPKKTTAQPTTTTTTLQSIMQYHKKNQKKTTTDEEEDFFNLPDNSHSHLHDASAASLEVDAFDLLDHSNSNSNSNNFSFYNEPWQQEQAEEVAKRVRDSRSTRHGRRTISLDSGNGTGVEVTVINPVRAKIGGQTSTSGSRKTKKKKGLPPRHFSDSSRKDPSAKRRPRKQPLVLSSTSTPVMKNKLTDSNEAKLHKSCPFLDWDGATTTASSTTTQTTTSDEPILSTPKANTTNNLTLSSNSDHSLFVTRRGQKKSNGSMSGHSGHGSSSRRNTVITEPVPLLKPSKRDTGNIAKVERGRALASRRIESAKEEENPENTTTTMECSSNNMSDEHRIRSTSEHRRRPHRRSLEPPKARSCVSKGQRSSRSRSRTRRTRRASIGTPCSLPNHNRVLLNPGEKAFVPEERRKSRLLGSTTTAITATTLQSSSSTDRHTAKLQAGTEHKAERRRRQRNSTGHDILKQTLALTTSRTATAAAPWEKRAANSRLLLEEEATRNAVAQM